MKFTTPFHLSPALSCGLIRFGLCLSVLPLSAAEPTTSHWPQWRGPTFNGVAPGAMPPTSWSETSNIKWKVKTPGRGTSTPIIWGENIYLQTAIATGKKSPEAEAAAAEAKAKEATTPPPSPPAPGAEAPSGGEGRRSGRGGPGGGRGGFGRGEKPTEFYQFALVCLDRETGKEKWQKVAHETVPHEGHHRDHSYASHSPVTDGSHVYAWFGSRGLHCYTMDGQLKWSKDFGKMATRAGFGEGSSPALHGETLVINWDHEGDDFVLALDKATGKELWRRPREEPTSWSTPLIVTHDGVTQAIVSAEKRVRSYDLKTGADIWECGGLTGNVVPTPIAANGLLYTMSGFRGAALMAIKLGQKGDLTDNQAAVAFRHDKRTPYVPSPLLYGDNLYFFSGNDAILSCLNAKTGVPSIEAERLEGPNGIYASPVGANGFVYLVGRNGTTLVLKNTGQLDIVATNPLDEKVDASPAIVGKSLFLRGHEHLYCIEQK